MKAIENTSTHNQEYILVLENNFRNFQTNE